MAKKKSSNLADLLPRGSRKRSAATALPTCYAWLTQGATAWKVLPDGAREPYPVTVSSAPRQSPSLAWSVQVISPGDVWKTPYSCSARDLFESRPLAYAEAAKRLRKKAGSLLRTAERFEKEITDATPNT